MPVRAAVAVRHCCAVADCWERTYRSWMTIRTRGDDRTCCIAAGDARSTTDGRLGGAAAPGAEAEAVAKPSAALELDELAGLAGFDD
jgi:hypothetical protein